MPDAEAHTTQAQPTLYWYQSKEAPTHCEVTLTEPKNPKPLLSLNSAAPTPAGIHELRLSKTKVELKPGVVYRWSIAVVVDPQNRSQDIIANGVIKRVDVPADLKAKLDQASDADKPALYAESGIWYDALQAISDQIAKDPGKAAFAPGAGGPSQAGRGRRLEDGITGCEVAVASSPGHGPFRASSRALHSTAKVLRDGADQSGGAGGFGDVEGSTDEAMMFVNFTLEHHRRQKNNGNVL